MGGHATCVRGAACAVASCAVSAGGLVLLDGRRELLVLVNAGLIITVAALAVVALRVFRDVREQQRRILAHMEVQTRVLRNAARAAATDSGDEFF